MSLLPLVDGSLLGRAARPALEFAGARFTFGEIEARSNRVAHVLRARGLQRGDRLAFFLQNRPEVIDLWLAAVKTGVVLVPVNVLYRERELKHILADSEPRAVVASRDMAGFIPAGVPIWDVDALASDAATQPTTRLAESCDADTPLALIYTSGTTGASKGTVLTHGNFAANGATLARDWRFTDSDRLLCTLPLFHVHGLANGIHCWLMSGCHLRLTERFEHAKAAEWFDDYRPTVFFGVPAMFVRLLELPEAVAKPIGARLRLAVSGSAPLPAEIHERFRQLYGSVILERYGMTETLMNVGNPYDGERRPGTVGLPLAHVQVKICDEAGAIVADGTGGELWVRGPNVCAGYWRRPDATAAAWRDGWFRTGDIGVRAADAYITLQGRRSDLIISGGFNVYPSEVEQVIWSHPAVMDCAVIGVPDDNWGEAVKAVVELKPGATVSADKLIALCKEKVGSVKAPKTVDFVELLPRSPVGKVLKKDIRATYWQNAGRAI